MTRSDEIEATYDGLMRQAPRTVQFYVSELRELMGADWCDRNPDALARLVLASALDFQAATIGKELARLRDAVVSMSRLGPSAE